MKKKISVGLSALATLLLIFVLLFTSADLWMQSRSFVTKEYSRLTISREMGISNADLVTGYFRLTDYMHGSVPDIGVVVTQNGEKIHLFSDEQEIRHMADVKTLYQSIRALKNTALIAMAALLAGSVFMTPRAAAHSVAKGYCYGTFILLLPVAFIGTWAVLDFGKFWTFFHEALFWNEDWLFPETSRMIQMLPETFFGDLVLRIVLTTGLAVVLLFALALLVIRLCHRREEKRYEAALEQRRKERKARKDRKLLQAALEAAGEAESAQAGAGPRKKTKKRADASGAPQRKKKKRPDTEVSE
ncbi:MAG: TIGR01906 family membrane protein [Clostridia bacterium]|nr:TIGR01906 family membrane protein [Clostridia bacterium]